MAGDTMVPPVPGGCAAVEAQKLAMGLLAWGERQQFATYDWWDIWGTRFGQWAKSSYVRGNPAGYAGVAMLTLLDLVYPSSRRLFVERRRFPISVAHFGLGFVNLWHATRDERYLQRALALETEVLALACPAASGLAWGMKHEWMTIHGLVPADTPCNTQTAYPYRFFAELREITGEARFDQHLRRIADHVSRDFPETRNGELLSASYSTIDNRRVVNSNSYRAYMLLDAAKRFDDPLCRDKGEATVRYVLSMQNADGSWPYSEDQAFVDGYHTCFVLKNLEASRLLVTDEGLRSRISDGIEAGYKHFFGRLFDARGYPIPFSVLPRLTLYAYDGYDLAETIGLLAEFGRERERLPHLLAFARERFLTRDGWFIFRIYKGIPAIKGIPYIRYANSAMFFALTKVMRYRTEQESHAPTHR